jgi:hypothetical protein
MLPDSTLPIDFFSTVPGLLLIEPPLPFRFCHSVLTLRSVQPARPEATRRIGATDRCLVCQLASLARSFGLRALVVGARHSSSDVPISGDCRYRVNYRSVPERMTVKAPEPVAQRQKALRPQAPAPVSNHLSSKEDPWQADSRMGQNCGGLRRARIADPPSTRAYLFVF